MEGKIRLAPLCDVDIDKSKWLLSTAAMVEGITKLISSNPQRDRDELVRKRNNIWGKTRKILNTIPDNSVLRDLYLETKDDEIFNILNRYFTSVNKLLWNNAAPDSIINKTIGISALFDSLKLLLKKNRDIHDFDPYIEKIVDIAYSDNYFSLTGKGKTRLKRIMKYKLGLMEYSGLHEDDKPYVNHV